MSKVEIFQGKDGFYFRIVEDTGSVVLLSESYSTRANAKKGAESALRNANSSVGVVRKIAKNGKYFFVVRSVKNGKTLGKSIPYSSKTGRDWGISKVSKAKNSFK